MIKHPAESETKECSLKGKGSAGRDCAEMHAIGPVRPDRVVTVLTRTYDFVVSSTISAEFWLRS